MVTSKAEAVEEVAAVVKRAKLGLADSVAQALQCIEADRSSCLEFVSLDMCGAIVQLLATKRNVSATTRLMSILTHAALRGARHEKASSSVIQANGIDPLLGVLSSRQMRQKYCQWF